jgi:hypothetical protein
MLPFPMFRSRQSRPHSQLPSACVQDLSVPATCSRHRPRSARHSSTCDLTSILPPVTSHASPITNSFRIRTYEKHAPNPFRIRTSKTQDLKPFRMNTSDPPPGGVALMVKQKSVERFLSRTTIGSKEFLATGNKRSFWGATNCGHSLAHRQLPTRLVCSQTSLWPLRVPSLTLYRLRLYNWGLSL